MPTPTIATIRTLEGVGILADCTPATFGHVFRRHNLVYGFNGSGKTTLTRLLDSLSERGISPKLEPTASFCFELSDGTRPDSTNPHSTASRFIAVFNEDYVERSLAWSSGTAEAIVYVGQEQAELAAELVRLEAAEVDQSAADQLAASELSSKERELANFSRDVARLISEEAGLGRSYNATNLKQDFESENYGPDNSIPDEARVQLRQTINQTTIPSKISAALQPVSPSDCMQKSSSCLQATLAKLTIESLERRQDSLEWVKEGIELHEHEEDCLFCGNRVTKDRLSNLSVALGAGFDQLRSLGAAATSSLQQLGNTCRQNRDALTDLGETLPAHASVVGTARSGLAHLYVEGEEATKTLIAKVSQKLGDPEAHLSIDFDFLAWAKSVEESEAELRKALDANNLDIDDFSSKQSAARTKLKRHHLAHYDSAYRDLISTVDARRSAYERASKDFRETTRIIADTRSRLRTHGAAADKINEILRGYLGHEEIQLVANDEGYQLMRRGSSDPKPLSEGEKTAIAFSHFLATLHSDGRRPQDFIVVLDDPISSLDARAMTHAVALVQQRFSEPLQLFVLTHNLDFMREMKKWLQNKYKNDLASFLFIQTEIRDGSRVSKLVQMPKLIREYESEYHYLYSLVKLLADNPDRAENFAYLMPNALRKVLDIFLAFKIPGNAGLSSKVDKMIVDFPGLDAAQVKAMERLTQLESHSESIGDTTTFSAYTLEQLSDAAKCMMNVVGTLDPAHKRAMDSLCS